MRALVAAVVFVVGCSEAVELLPTRDLGGLPGASDGGGVGLPTPMGTQCAAAVAAGLHRFALCSCSAFSSTQLIGTTVFDSTGATTNRTGAAVGANGGFSNGKLVSLEGALWASGAVQLGDGLTTTETARAAATLSSTNATTVGSDAYAGGDVSGSVSVAGTLHVPSTASVASSVQAGAVVREAVSVPDPCDCASAAAIDVAGAVAAAAGQNDDAAAGLSAGTLTTGASLPAGSFYVAAIAIDQDATLAVHGRAALFVGGDVRLNGAWSVALDAGAELDLFVAGTVSTSSNRTFGATTAPARVRIWTNAASLVLDGTPTLGAVLTAPAATVSAPGGITLYGSLLAQSFAPGNDVTVHWDQAILSAGTVCGGAPLPAVH